MSTKGFKVRILGTGTSTGVPLPGCPCGVCQSGVPENQRLRASAWLQIDGRSILIDPSIDFRQQALLANIQRIDAVWVTHPHTDHISGFDDLRPYNFLQNQTIPLFGHAWTLQELRQRFHYAFAPAPKVPKEGGGIPRIDLHEIKEGLDELQMPEIKAKILWLNHGSKITLGFRVEDFAYCTDFNNLEDSELSKLRELSVLILDCVRLKPHSTHLHLEGALEWVKRLQPKRTILTHMGHDIDARVWSPKLPTGVEFGVDGLEIVLR